MKKTYIFTLLGLLLIGLLSGCAEKEKLSDGTELVEKGKFIYAASGEFKPFSYMKKDLTMTGFDIAVG